MLKIHQVTKVFGGVVALDSVSFDVRMGNIVSLVGPNGAGKTTLFNVIAGIYSCDSGRIIFDDQDITTLPTHKKALLASGELFRTFVCFQALMY